MISVPLIKRVRREALTRKKGQPALALTRLSGPVGEGQAHRVVALMFGPSSWNEGERLAFLLAHTAEDVCKAYEMGVFFSYWNGRFAIPTNRMSHPADYKQWLVDYKPAPRRRLP